MPRGLFERKLVSSIVLFCMVITALVSIILLTHLVHTLGYTQ